MGDVTRSGPFLIIWLIMGAHLDAHAHTCQVIASYSEGAQMTSNIHFLNPDSLYVFL